MVGKQHREPGKYAKVTAQAYGGQCRGWGCGSNVWGLSNIKCDAHLGYYPFDANGQLPKLPIVVYSCNIMLISTTVITYCYYTPHSQILIV